MENPMQTITEAAETVAVIEQAPNPPVKTRNKKAPIVKKAAATKKTVVAKKSPAVKKAVKIKKVAIAPKKSAPKKAVAKATEKIVVAKPVKEPTIKEKSKKDTLKAQIAAKLQINFAEIKEIVGEKKFESMIKKVSKILAAGAGKKPKK